jgi:ABC-type antimicrobial peptide transport system permease subunit
MSLVLRSPLGAASLTQQLQTIVDRMDPAVRLGNASPQQELLDQFLLPQRVASQVAGALGAVGLVLAVMGVYGMVSFSAASRRRELGIRLALGAPPQQSVRLLLRSALALVAGGGAAGLAASAALGPLLSSFLVGISPLDPVTLLTVSIAILVAAGTAAYFPARRAARIDAAESLRTE